MTWLSSLWSWLNQPAPFSLSDHAPLVASLPMPPCKYAALNKRQFAWRLVYWIHARKLPYHKAKEVWALLANNNHTQFWETAHQGRPPISHMLAKLHAHA